MNLKKKSKLIFNTEEERLSAEKVLNEVNKKLDGKVVTIIRKEKNYCKNNFKRKCSCCRHKIRKRNFCH